MKALCPTVPLFKLYNYIIKQLFQVIFKQKQPNGNELTPELFRMV